MFKAGDKVRLNQDYGGKAAGFVSVIEEVVSSNREDGPLYYLKDLGGAYAKRFELVEQPWQPKVGDRVRYEDGTVHGAGVVREKEEHGWLVDVEAKDKSYAYFNGSRWFSASSLSPLPVAAEAQPAALQIEAGKFYRTRDGRKVGPMETFLNMFSAKAEGTHRIFQADGTHGSQHVTNLPHLDIIAEWVDEPTVAVAATASNDNAAPKFKVGDRVRIVRNSRGDGHLNKNIGREFTITMADGPNNTGWSGAAEESPYWWPESDIDLATSTPTAIVALIENGQPKPSSRPYVHATEEAASKEAARLAGIHKGQHFGVYVLAHTVSEEKPAYKHEWQRLAADGQKIAAIKELRAVTGMQLKPAKDVVEHFIDYPYGHLAA
ncbi:ribosomal protein L7/L12 [Sinorhizobium sp. BJ1]|uniref:ribosomal protein L7/L12 n=1 Tax=Sinorhizobium sp. BJ1 TaxID=2035455 RepID=UPI000BE97267|nr:ribosomal protein L7/L12 [Sinorhizobium sp. BJ1]PDT86535.1 hypothetical protein CO676_02270 [Sinorhizobium sp. BJ1]